MSDRTRRVLPLLALALLLAGLMFFQLPGAQAQATVWVRQFGSSAHDTATSLAVSPTGNIYVAGGADGALPGQTFAGGARDAFVRRYDANGAEVWTRQFGTSETDVVMDVTVDPAGNVYVGGQTGGALAGQSPAGEFDAFVRKYDNDGNEVWTRQFGASGASAAAALTVEQAGNVYVAGWAHGALPGQTSIGQYDAFVRKYSASGSEVWTRQFGTREHDRASHMGVDPAGNVDVAAGGPRGNTHRESFARKYDPNGVDVQTRQLQATGVEEIRGVAVDPAGNIYVAGQTDVDHGHAFVRKYDRNGSEVWTRELRISETDVAVDVAVEPSGAVYVGGQTAAAEFDAFVRKYDDNGTELWTRFIATSGNEVASSLAVDPSGTVYLTGWTSGTFSGQSSAGLSDAFVAKLR